MIAVIMAGGKGTRIASVSTEVPKPMIPLCGKPVLEWQLECLKAQNITEILLVTGHLHQVISDYFGDGSRMGMQISYLVEESPLGTAGAFYYLKDRLDGDFLLLNGDVMFDVDFARFAQAHQHYGGAATIFTHPNQHPYDSGIVVCKENGQVVNWLHKEEKREWYANRVNAGLHLFSPGIFEWMKAHGMLQKPEKLDLDRQVLKPLLADGLLYAYQSPEYVKDMGTPERYEMVQRDIRSGLVSARNLSNPQKAVFLDRDGTINKYVGFLRSTEQMELLPQAAQAIRKLNEAGWLVILATNQPVIARGEVSEEELTEIHNKLETLLGKEGAYVDAIYYCPHHPDKGFAGERPEYKIECSCRKPKPGLLFRAAQDYHIDLKKSWMVGDSAADMGAGKAAGCKTAGVYGEKSGDESFATLAEFAAFLCGREKA